MARITVEDCIDKFESRFELVLVASNRARKLHAGDAPTVEKDNDKNTVIALREIAGETIAIDNMKSNLIEEYQTVSSQDEEDLIDENSQNSDSDDNQKDQVDEIKALDEDIEESFEVAENKDEKANDDIVENSNEGTN